MRFETKSAVSRRVSWDIWSTMVVIFGFVLEGDAVVDSCRRNRRWWRHVIEGMAWGGREVGRRARAQQRRVGKEGGDMVEDVAVIWVLSN